MAAARILKSVKPPTNAPSKNFSSSQAILKGEVL